MVMTMLNNRRLYAVMLIFLFMFLSLVGRLINLQLLNYSQYAQQAANLQERHIPEEPIPRGNILDRNYRSITDGGLKLSLVLIPSLFQYDPDKVSELENIVGKLSLPNKSYATGSKPVFLQPDLTLQESNIINNLDIAGLFVVPMKIRYGSQSMARHLVGHLNEGVGAMGLEARYQTELNRASNENNWSLLFDARGNLIKGLSFKKVEEKSSDDRLSLRTTLDLDVQVKVEAVMDEQIEKGAVVVMEVGSGEVLAAASRPNYQQDKISQALKNDGSLFNRVMAVYHPGSIFKIVVAVAALEEGIVTPDEEFNCTGSYIFPSGLEIPCWKTDGHGKLTFAQALAQSCNPTFISVALRLGKEKLLEYVDKFGLEQEALIGWYNLAASEVVSDTGDNTIKIGYSPGDLGNAAVGQKGVMISPLQVASLTNVIASGGMWTEPRLIDTVVDDQGRIVTVLPPSKTKRVIKRDTAIILQQMMLLTTKEGTGTKAWVPEGGSAGKTSSAETGALDEAGNQIVNAWFTGYVPTERPQYVISVLAEGGIYGGQVAAPVFKEIGEYLMFRKISEGADSYEPENVLSN